MRTRMLRRLVVGAALVAPILMPSSAAAHHCPVAESPRTLQAESVALYLVVRTDGTPHLYVETNDTLGLQRGGTHPVLGNDTCNHSNPDTRVF